MTTPPAPILRGLRWGLWALLVMVLGGLVLVWLSTRGAPTEIPTYGELPAFDLIDHRGRTITGDDLAGRPWVADMIFTRCAATCPLMTEAMKDLGTELPEGVRRVSISVDPAHDRPEVLAEYARSHGVGPDDDWLFLTGPRPEVIDLVQGGFKLGVADDPGNEEEPITHSTKFVLVDGESRIRGYFDGLDPESRKELAEAAEALLETETGS